MFSRIKIENLQLWVIFLKKSCSKQRNDNAEFRLRGFLGENLMRSILLLCSFCLTFETVPKFRPKVSFQALRIPNYLFVQCYTIFQTHFRSPWFKLSWYNFYLLLFCAMSFRIWKQNLPLKWAISDILFPMFASCVHATSASIFTLLNMKFF